MRLTIEIPDALGASIAAEAAAEGRAPEALALDALAEHMAELLEIRARLLRGEADIAAGRTVPNDAVMAEMRDWAAGIKNRTLG